MRQGRLVIAALAWGAGLAAGDGLGRDAGARDQSAGDWQVVTLGHDAGCAAVQVVVGRRTGAVLAQMLLLPAPREGAVDDGALVAVRVPNGVSLADGIAYRHPGRDSAVGLGWQACDADRCTATAAITVAERDRLLRGREVILGYRPLPDSAVLNLPVSLIGLTDAWRGVEACRAQ